MSRLRALLSATVVIVLLAGCSDRGTEPFVIDDEPPVADDGPPVDDGGPPVDDGEDEEEFVSYAAAVQRIWTDNCIGCHGVGGNGGLDLRAPGSRANLVDVASDNWSGQRVVADKPDLSVLYLKLTGDGTAGQIMPPTGSLGVDDIETVRLWIAEGALDN